MQRSCSPTRSPSPTRRERSASQIPFPHRRSSSASGPRKKPNSTQTTSRTTAHEAAPIFTALKFAARPQVPRGDSVLPLRTEKIAYERGGARSPLIPDDPWEPQTVANDEEEFHLLRRQFSTLTDRHRNRWVKAKLEAPCGQEWQQLIDCYLDKGAHPMLCLDEEASMRRCQQRMVRCLFGCVRLTTCQPEMENAIKAQNWNMTQLASGLRK